MRTFFVLSLAVLAAGSAAAQTSVLDDASIGGGDRYDNCLLLVRSAPDTALKAATDWESRDGGGSAMHCSALALIALHRYSEAASKLDSLARATKPSDERATLYDQAGNAWLLAHQASNAQSSFAAAITFRPRDPDLYVDRARAFAMKPDWLSASNDLTTAIGLDPNRSNLYVLRASALHALGKKADALADVERALKVDPRNADALELRGEMKMETGDQAGAKADWQAAIAQSPRSAAAAQARNDLNALSQPAPPKH